MLVAICATSFLLFACLIEHSTYTNFKCVIHKNFLGLSHCRLHKINIKKIHLVYILNATHYVRLYGSHIVSGYDYLLLRSDFSV